MWMLCYVAANERDLVFILCTRFFCSFL
jgi:hypothetical protein